jgi:hypothetical protein
MRNEVPRPVFLRASRKLTVAIGLRSRFEVELKQMLFEADTMFGGYCKRPAGDHSPRRTVALVRLM